MTRVKICGLTRPDDVLAAADAGAHALGFIAVPGTPRYVSPERFQELCRAAPPYVTLVVVARTIAEAAAYGADVVQFYEGEPSGRCVRVLRLRDEADLERVQGCREPLAAIHLDAWHASALGGTGIALDRELARRAVRLSPLPVILAGGLTPESVGEAVRHVAPWAVDVSSGVESAPGVKDAEKMRAFVAAATAPG